ncbi:Histone-lysine N-methyltransferase like protein [Argiope bruennichi]|uniref:Histone-lysine N-methyltransferase like protein n=1 Tax=Argiope bruennichi TaxID=94029 RepID=A0A8T0FMH8_ARGBR|nr:Histone-lysine N-methyltransferase like protein [Argiope bruennichi]
MSYEDNIARRRQENRELLKQLGIFSLRQEHRVVKSPDTSQSPKKYLRNVSKASKPTFKASDLIPRRKSSRLLGKLVFLALSGYEDDVGPRVVLFTGEGGRDLRGTKTNPKNLRTAPQSKDQVLERGNLALSKNVENNLPVRVLRGYKLRSKFAPEEGYRYDGLYNVVEYYLTTGISGFKVYKFRMERIKDQEPAPWAEDFVMPEPLENSTFSPEKENVSKEDQLQNEESEASDSLAFCPEKEKEIKEDSQLQNEN